MHTKVLITVKTYPTLSTKYEELVCTAGFREDCSWVRIYPIPFRKLDYDKRYAKYQWIELELVKNESDPRPESYKPFNYEKIMPGEKIGTQKGSWEARKEIVLKKVHKNLNQLIDEAKDRNICTSLAVFKPTKINDFVVEETSREWDEKKLAQFRQFDLFQHPENPFKVVSKIPYKFFYVYEDDSGKKTKMMIEDWEIGQLFWNCLTRHDGDEYLACEDVRKKYFDDFAKTKDLYFYLGSTLQYHFVSPNPFIIIGTFHPKRQRQLGLF